MSRRWDDDDDCDDFIKKIVKIIGIIVGLVVLVIVVFCLCRYMRRRKQTKATALVPQNHTCTVHVNSGPIAPFDSRICSHGHVHEAPIRPISQDNSTTLVPPRVDRVEPANVFVVTKGDTEPVVVNQNRPNDNLPTYDEIIANNPMQNR